MKFQPYCLAVVAISATISPTRGDTPAPPSTFKQVSDNGKFVFVVLAPESTDKELQRYNEKYQKTVREIREHYTKSGMYRNDGSNAPLWTVDWWAGVTVSGDGKYVIRHGHWSVLANQSRQATKSDLVQTAFSVYANGKLVRSYKINELVDDPALMLASVSHFEWLRKGKINDAQHRYEIETYDGNRVIFDLETGAILSKVHQPTPRRKPEDREVAPAKKWIDKNDDLKLMEQCPSGVIATGAEFEKVWKLLRGKEKLPEVDFTREFVWITTYKGWNIVDINFRGPEYEDDNVADGYPAFWSGDKAIPGFSYAIAVFKRDRLEPVDGKVLIKDKKK